MHWPRQRPLQSVSIPLMPQFKIVEVQPCDPDVWLAAWAAKYDDSASFDEDEYTQLIGLAQQNGLPAKYFERVGRWKDSANIDRRWKPNVASVAYIVWLQAEAEQPLSSERASCELFGQLVKQKV